MSLLPAGVKPYFEDESVAIVNADCREVLREMPNGSVHCVVTSPPYWGLRDYGIEPSVWDGDLHWPGSECEHEWNTESITARHVDDGITGSTLEGGKATQAVSQRTPAEHAFCHRCNAWRGTLGLEPTPELYVQHIVEVFREVRRVLRDDGTLWLNMGDSYASQPAGNNTPSGFSQTRPSRRRHGVGDETVDIPPKNFNGLKPKDLVGIPWRVAFALQADGWWLRSDIIWSKPNPMPESVTDRPTRAHEYVFLLAKAERYFYDADAIREPSIRQNSHDLTGPGYAAPGQTAQRGSRKSKRSDGWASYDGGHGSIHRDGRENGAPAEIPMGRNKRSVWEIATQPFPEAHFATFPEALVKPCIQAGTSEWGCCPECGAPWERVVERQDKRHWTERRHDPSPKTRPGLAHGRNDWGWDFEGNDSVTVGWRPTCAHEAEGCPSCGGVIEYQGEHTGAHLQVLPEEVSGSVEPGQASLLQPNLPSEVRSQDEADNEGLCHDGQGIQGDLSAKPPDGDAGGLRIGAPSGDGREDGPKPDGPRGGRSHQRNQGGQSPGEPTRHDEEGPRQDVQSGSSPNGPMSRVRSSVPAQGTCGQCGSGLIRGPLAPIPSTALDIFAGAGTVGVVARKAGRRAVLIEAKEDYCAMMRDRMLQKVLL